ncbi:hypothetical protein [Leisingera sp. ANG-Vp]|uniref:hypothetical protein n=1 Tax=Leisingera sp. ANG-Vp TaxID=1577896 RepID=UPI0006892620|nr:hypothetical protein [Leisingera sp. ANG-Vp]
MQILQTDAAGGRADPDALRLKAELEMASGCPDSAARTFQDLLDAAPGDEDALDTLISTLLQSGQFETARQQFEQRQPEGSDDFLNQDRALAYLSAAASSAAFGDLDSADFAGLFFLNALLSKNKSFLSQVSGLFSQHLTNELILAAEQYVASKGGTFCYVSLDTLFTVENRSQAEESILDQRLWEKPENRMTWLRSGPPHVQQMYGGFDSYSPEYLHQIFSGPGNAVLATRVVMNDFASTHVNISGNLRRTLPDIREFDNRILLLGASDVYGFGCEDRHTIASFLQASVAAAGRKYRVENHGVRGNPMLVCLCNLFQTAIEPGDIVVLFGEPVAGKTSEFERVRRLHCDFSRPHGRGEIFIDQSHLGWTGSEWVAEQLETFLFEDSEDRTDSHATDLPHLPGTAAEKIARNGIELIKYLIFKHFSEQSEKQGLLEYTRYIAEHTQKAAGTAGSVAVNCNPITLGHLHLLEYAASKVDFLYVFVIEEDQSFFSFEDRIQLVSQAVEHLPNTKVLKGGKYICTEFTYPEYFTKDDVQNVAADASLEAWFFCEYIAKALNISTIFLGDEPNCKITQQYNEKMTEILPAFGIQVDIIPRISAGGRVISASTVRKLLADREFGQIKELVPDCTYRFLVENYS